jgi:hypothetical protein
LGTIVIRCPRTGADVSTGIELDRQSWDTLPIVPSTFRCAACGAEHVWSKTYARYVAARTVPSNSA